MGTKLSCSSPVDLWRPGLHGQCEAATVEAEGVIGPTEIAQPESGPSATYSAAVWIDSANSPGNRPAVCVPQSPEVGTCMSLMASRSVRKESLMIPLWNSQESWGRSNRPNRSAERSRPTVFLLPPTTDDFMAHSMTVTDVPGSMINGSLRIRFGRFSLESGEKLGRTRNEGVGIVWPQLSD